MNYKIYRLSKDKGNFLFGFHDISPWNYDSNRHICLRIDDISLPPNPNKEYDVGYIDNNGTFTKVCTTKTFNYPQGARQQWIQQSNNIVVNDRYDNVCKSKVVDSNTGKILRVLDYPTHTVDKEGFAYSLDYARLFRLGAYGYAGLIDKYANESAPKESGIIKHSIFSDENSMLISVDRVASFNMNKNISKQHYITHALLSPFQDKIAFLHRYKLSDGGETTRLMTVKIDGTDLKCLASGFLSHFDWADNNNILIFGRVGSFSESIRGSFIYHVIPPWVLKRVKQFIKSYFLNSQAANISAFAWMQIGDQNNNEITKVADKIIKEDGHPMFNPQNRDLMICDNYPDSNGYRTLFVYNISTKIKTDLGRFKMIEDKPDIKHSISLLQGVDSDIVDSVGIDNLAFTRSGYHCDLHPRWSLDGKRVSFDSIHEGSRQIYVVDFEETFFENA